MIPLLLVTGFLGAGKTTFLRGLLPALGARGLRPRVVLNDYADARIDGATLSDLAPDLVALSGSCVCCESLEDLVATLRGLRGGPGEVAIVEANGGTEAGELLEVLGGAPELDHLSAPLQLTVVDAKRFATRGWQDQIEREQLETATHVALGRLDLVSEARAAEVAAAVARLSPRARRTTHAGLADALATLAAEAATTPDKARPAHHHDHHHDHGHGHAREHGHPFATHVAALPTPVDAAALLAWLRALPPEVLRAKGIVALRAPAGAKRSFQKVGDEAEISPCELLDPDALETRIIFVGPALPVAQLETLVAALGGPA